MGWVEICFHHTPSCQTLNLGRNNTAGQHKFINTRNSQQTQADAGTGAGAAVDCTRRIIIILTVDIGLATSAHSPTQTPGYAERLETCAGSTQPSGSARGR